MPNEPITTGTHTQTDLLFTLLGIVTAAAHQPGTLDEANALLFSVEDAAMKAIQLARAAD